MPTPADVQRVKVLAYQLWEQEGRPSGRDKAHWEEAEKRLHVEFRVGYPDDSAADSPDASDARDASPRSPPPQPAARQRRSGGKRRSAR